MFSNYGREITKHTVIHGVYVRFWATLLLHLPRKTYLRSAEKSSIGMASGSRNLYTTCISCL